MREKFKVDTRNKLLLPIILLILVLVLLGCSNQASEPRPKAKEGIIDLSYLELENNVVNLDGEWEFYWNSLIEPDKLDSTQMTGYISIPSSWNRYLGNEENSGYGYATYRLQFITEINDNLALKLPRLFTAYDLWVNDELIITAGKLGKTRETMTPQYLPQVALFEAQEGVNEILIQVSNYHHRSGGILESISLGGVRKILDLRYKRLANEFIIFGCLLCIGAYHLSLYFFRKKNFSSLYFGLFCIFIGMRTMLVGERFLIHFFPNFNWEIAHKIQTLTYYFGVPLVLMFLKSVFPKYYHTRIIRISQFIGAVFGLLVLLTPARVFTQFNIIYQIWTVIAIIYIIVILIKLGIKKEPDSLYIILGALALLFTSANDVIFHNIWLNDKGPAILRALIRTGNLSSLGQFVFAFSNSLLLAKRFSDSLEQEVILTAELKDINANLDEIVLHRTEALIESNEKIEQQKKELQKINKQLQELSSKDPLTQLWNRRKYDEMIELEWKRCLRYQRPIALIIMDIDFFKAYNDHHGHLVGDECLTKIGQTIRSSLSRSADIAIRYGGEEFIVILQETEKEEAIEVAEMLRQKIETLQIRHEQSSVGAHITISVGVSVVIPNDSVSSEDLFSAADKALYKAKENGRNQVIFGDVQNE